MSNILMDKKFNWIWMSSLIIIIILGSIFFHSFNRGFYITQYKLLNTAESMNISDNELTTSTGVLLDYIMGNRDNLEVNLESGEPFFNQKEVDHMVDVRGLYQGAHLVFIISLVLFIALTIFYINQGSEVFWFTLKQSYKTAFILFGGIIGLIALYAAIDFDGFWTNFHHVFFRNDLWLLDPTTDRLIQLVPLPFFNQLIRNIIFTIVFLLILITLLVLFFPRQNAPKIHIVLYEPEIPQNTGNIMRTAMATNAQLHLIEPLGFIYDEKRMKRSGMDYIDSLEITRHDNWESFLQTVDGQLYYVTRYGEKSHTQFNYRKNKKNLYLVFGKESTGIPLEILSSNLEWCMRIPMVKEARSLNLANSVAIVTYEVLRQLNYQDLSLVETQKGSDWLRNHQ